MNFLENITTLNTVLGQSNCEVLSKNIGVWNSNISVLPMVFVMIIVNCLISCGAILFVMWYFQREKDGETERRGKEASLVNVLKEEKL